MLTTGSKSYSNPQIVLRNVVGPGCGNPRNDNNKEKWLMIIIIAIVVLSFIIYSLSHAAGEKMKSRSRLWIEQYSSMYLGKEKRWIEVAAAIQHIESNTCQHKVGHYDPSFGCGGMKVAAVVDAAKYWKIKIPSTNDRIIWNLLRNDRFSIQMSVAYLGYLYRVFKNERIAIIAYNIGIEKTKGLLSKKEPLPTEYYNKIQTHIQGGQYETGND